MVSSHHFYKHQRGTPTKTLLIVKAAVEALAGLALVTFPSLAIYFLTGQMLTEPGGYVLGRIAGVALVALGISCWLARNESQSRADLGLIGGLLFYDVGVTLILLAKYFGHGAIGLALFSSGDP